MLLGLYAQTLPMSPRVNDYVYSGISEGSAVWLLDPSAHTNDEAVLDHSSNLLQKSNPEVLCCSSSECVCVLVYAF